MDSEAASSNTSASHSHLRARLNRELGQISEWTPQQCCRWNCTGRIGVQGCRSLRAEFLQSSQLERKSKLLNMRVRLSGSRKISDSDSPEEGEKYGLAYSDIVLCTRFLVTVLNVHSNLASSVLKRPSALSPDIPGRHVNSSSYGTFETSVIMFLHKLADEVGDEMPNTMERHLPHKSKKLVCMLYCESERSRQQRFSTKSHFYRVWKNLAPQIKCRKSHTFAVCDTCVSFRDRLMQIARKASRDREREALLNGFRTHLRQVKLERTVYAENRLKAIEQPEHVLSVIIDGADQSKFGIPRFLEKSKSESGHSIKQKLTGVLFHGGLGREEFLAYLTSPDTLPGGANQTIDAFGRCFLVLLERRAFNQRLGRPKTLYIQLDNTSKDNKNRFFMAFCEWLVHHGVFESIHVNFLPVGHTHEDVDRKFSRVSVALACQETITIQDLHRVIKSSVLSENKPHVTRVRGYNNFSAAMKSQACIVKSIPRFNTYRKFVFQREGAVDMRAESISYYVSSHAAASMTVPKADWTKLEKSYESIGSFLVHDIDLNKIPLTFYTKLSEPDIKQLKKRVYSVQTRIRSREKFNELLKNIEGLENDTIASSEWNPKLIIEKPLRLQPNVILSDDSESDDEQEYSVGKMVTIRHSKSNSATPFWLGAITKVDLASKNHIEVNWFEIVPDKEMQRLQTGNTYSGYFQRESCYSARYRPCMATNSVRLCDEISAKSILVLFDELTSSNTLPIIVQKMTKQCLDPFAEYVGEAVCEDGDDNSDDSGNIIDSSSDSNDVIGSESQLRESRPDPKLRNSRTGTKSSSHLPMDDEEGTEIGPTVPTKSVRNESKNEERSDGRRGGRQREMTKSAANLRKGRKKLKLVHQERRSHSIENGCFVAVNCPRTEDNDPFWLAQVNDERETLEGDGGRVKVIWFSPEQGDGPWNFSSFCTSTFRRTEDEDFISCGTVFWSFSKLTLKNKIPRKEISSIEKALRED